MPVTDLCRWHDTRIHSERISKAEMRSLIVHSRSKLPVVGRIQREFWRGDDTQARRDGHCIACDRYALHGECIAAAEQLQGGDRACITPGMLPTQACVRLHGILRVELQ